MRRWRRLVFPGLVAIAFYVAVAGGEHSLMDARRATAELDDRHADLRAVRHEIDSMRARIDSLRHHDGALERLARERYGFIRDGEYLYRVSDGTEDEKPDEP
ncbi:MAG: septum formation initiator family protein [Gemmatimonadota bacterium]|nr:septum formation initiator family protein [Gemmatimonadota bacterium]